VKLKLRLCSIELRGIVYIHNLSVKSLFQLKPISAYFVKLCFYEFKRMNFGHLL